MATLTKEKGISTHTYLGTHLIAEFFGCDADDDTGFIRRALREAVVASGATMLDEKYHKFSPQGITGYILLKESHISIHTWPEYGYAAVDVFTCGETMKPEAAIESLKNALRPDKVTMKKIMRGDVKNRPLA